MRTRIRGIVLAVLILGTAGVSSPSYAGLLSKAKKELTPCAAPLASVFIELPKEAEKQQWGELGLESPVSKLKEDIKESNCFTVVGSRARAEFLLRPSLSFTKGNKFGSSIGALTAFIPGAGFAGALAGSTVGFQAGKPKVLTQLTLTNLRDASVEYTGSSTFASYVYSAEERALLAQGNSNYRSGNDSYAGTETGREVTKSYRSALADLIQRYQGATTNPSKETESTVVAAAKPLKSPKTPVVNTEPEHMFTAPKPVNLRTLPSSGKESVVVRTIAQGEVLRLADNTSLEAASEKPGWTRVVDATGTEGWVRSDLLLQIQMPSSTRN